MLSLDGNGLQGVPECVAGLGRLTSLSLRRNLLQTLPPEVTRPEAGKAGAV